AIDRLLPRRQSRNASLFARLGELAVEYLHLRHFNAEEVHGLRVFLDADLAVDEKRDDLLLLGLELRELHRSGIERPHQRVETERHGMKIGGRGAGDLAKRGRRLNLLLHLTGRSAAAASRAVKSRQGIVPLSPGLCELLRKLRALRILTRQREIRRQSEQLL